MASGVMYQHRRLCQIPKSSVFKDGTVSNSLLDELKKSSRTKKRNNFFGPFREDSLNGGGRNGVRSADGVKKAMSTT